jgi:DNA-binding Xre family transcriptional regulator
MTRSLRQPSPEPTEFDVEKFRQDIREWLGKTERPNVYLAKKAGVRPTTLNQFLRGDYNDVRTNTFLLLCAFLQKDPIRYMKNRDRIPGML